MRSVRNNKVMNAMKHRTQGHLTVWPAVLTSKSVRSTPSVRVGSLIRLTHRRVCFLYEASELRWTAWTAREWAEERAGQAITGYGRAWLTVLTPHSCSLHSRFDRISESGWYNWLGLLASYSPVTSFGPVVSGLCLPNGLSARTAVSKVNQSNSTVNGFYQ